jgi:hypothetical protein
MLRSVQEQVQAVPLAGKTQSLFQMRHDPQIPNVRSGIALNYLGKATKDQLLATPGPANDLPHLGAPLPAEHDIKGMMRWPEYVFDSLDPGAAYLLRLHFVELHMTRPAERYFDVWINGKPVLVNLDIVGLTGARYKTLVKEVACEADDSGRIVLNLVSYHDSPGKATISGIELLRPDPSAAPTVPYQDTSFLPILQINAGGPAVGTFQADHYASGGRAHVVDQPIDLDDRAAPAPLAVYQSENTCAIEDQTDRWPRLSITCQTREDRLEFQIASHDNLHRRETVEALRQHFLDNLRSLI